MGRLSRFLGAGVLLVSAWTLFVVPPAVAAREGPGVARPEGQMILAQTISIAEGPGRRRAIQVRRVQAGRRAGPGGQRAVLAQVAPRQDRDHPERSRRN